MHQIVFTGRLLKGADRSTVEIEVQRLFKATPRQVEWFLRGKSIVVKSTDDAALAERYYAALVKIGLECELRGEQSAAAPMSPPPEVPMPPPAQLLVPGVPAATSVPVDVTASNQTPSVPMPMPMEPVNENSEAPTPTPPEPSSVARANPASKRAPGLSRVTHAITAQDRAPALTGGSTFSVRNSIKPDFPTADSSKLRMSVGLVILVLGAVLIGTLAYFARLEWQARHAPVPVKVDAPVISMPAAPAQTLDALIVGRWQCVDSGNLRVVEYEFRPDGRFRSLTHGKADAFQQIDQIDFLIEGRYHLEDRRVILHVERIPTRGLFGELVQEDSYLYWNIDSLTSDALSWNDAQVRKVSEGCLRSQSLH